MDDYLLSSTSPIFRPIEPLALQGMGDVTCDADSQKRRLVSVTRSGVESIANISGRETALDLTVLQQVAVWHQCRRRQHIGIAPAAARRPKRVCLLAAQFCRGAALTPSDRDRMDVIRRQCEHGITDPPPSFSGRARSLGPADHVALDREDPFKGLQDEISPLIAARENRRQGLGSGRRSRSRNPGDHKARHER